MTFNYAELVVQIERESASLSSAQRNGNIALMISIADRLTKFSEYLSNYLSMEVT